MKTSTLQMISVCLVLVLFCRCDHQKSQAEQSTAELVPMVLDTDANNELDDQHAMAYLFANRASFAIQGVTVNTTSSGGNIDQQYAEAERVMKLCDVLTTIPLLKGADQSFAAIRPTLDNSVYDGKEAVSFIVKAAKEYSATKKLVVIAVGKLTNVALALQKDSTIADKIRLVWLGSNYPEPGEHNQNNDTVAMNYLLNSHMAFEMVTVRYGKPSGTDAVRVTQQEVQQKMGGLGPQVDPPVEGRHGGLFRNFGDYSINLFEHIDYHGDPPSRALFDMAAVAIVKNPDWAERRTIPAPLLIDNNWVERPANPHHIVVWENFDRDTILSDFFISLGYHE